MKYLMAITLLFVVTVCFIYWATCLNEVTINPDGSKTEYIIWFKRVTKVRSINNCNQVEEEWIFSLSRPMECFNLPPGLSIFPKMIKRDNNLDGIWDEVWIYRVGAQLTDGELEIVQIDSDFNGSFDIKKGPEYLGSKQFPLEPPILFNY